jgi:enoyl-CoA hydratase
MAFKTLLTEAEGGVGVITLNRPDAMNALSGELTRELNAAFNAMEADTQIGCVILTGGPKVFSAGADIAEMQAKTYADAFAEDYVADWERVARCRKPVIAAVAGHALGGGCELALMCDIVLAGDNAKFGQPEIRLGISPGAGATQRLARAIGKAKTMEMCLTGRLMDAAEAERAGLACRVVAAAELLGEAKVIARKIAGMSRPVAMMTKELVNIAFETPLAQGLLFERRIFQSQFSMDDQKEGMGAFLEGRAAHFRNR